MVTQRRRSEGARQLGRLGLADADIAARLGCTQPEVNRWKMGVRVPRMPTREKMRDVLGIPLAAWESDVDEAPRAARRHGRPPAPQVEVTGAPLDFEPVKLPPRAPARSAVGAPPPVPAPPADVDNVASQAGELKALVREGIKAVREDRSMPPGERFRYLSECQRLLDKLGRITGESLVITETRIVRLPAFRLIVDELVRALDRWPDAQAAVADRLTAMGSR